ncbi:MAG: pyridoxamine 5'-phosphate oxidase [Candidatus Latescibacteria bacterium]|nr:pyridoxamine 5'-phosphate oxidase [Candidatus Latescibacterota bacterium]
MVVQGEEYLSPQDLDADPFVQFGRWFKEAQQSAMALPHAMALSTATPEGRPSSRMVLLQSFDERGFAFFTNYDSRKGEELAANPWAALLFHWEPLRRQVRLEGRVEKLTAEESDAYFHSRPDGAQLGAWASPQSQIIDSRTVLEERLAQEEQRLGNAPLPRPPFWGGYRLVPDCCEFWVSRASRLHDRLLYSRAEDGWQLQRLAP